MINAFPYDQSDWTDITGPFWQYSISEGAGIWFLTILGMIATVLAIVGWFYMDNRMLTRHAERLRAAGFGAGAAGTLPPAAGESGD